MTLGLAGSGLESGFEAGVGAELGVVGQGLPVVGSAGQIEADGDTGGKSFAQFSPGTVEMVVTQSGHGRKDLVVGQVEAAKHFSNQLQVVHSSGIRREGAAAWGEVGRLDRGEAWEAVCEWTLSERWIRGCGLVALVRPSKSILDVEVKSVKQKWKDKVFAAPVNRAEIEHAAVQLGVPLDEHIAVVLGALQKDADLVGLR